MVEGISELSEGVLLGERYRLVRPLETFRAGAERVAGVEYEYWLATDETSGARVWVQFAAADGVFAAGSALAGAVAALRRVNHPAVPAVPAFGEYEFEQDGAATAVGYCAIPAAEGETLAAALVGGMLERAEILAALGQVAEVLELLAEFELVHGHLSARSVLLSAGEGGGYAVMVADLPASLAVETALESELTSAADVYALAWLTVLALVGPAVLEAEFGSGFAVTSELELLAAQEVVERRRSWVAENQELLGLTEESAAVLLTALGEAAGRPRAAQLTTVLRAEWVRCAEAAAAVEAIEDVVAAEAGEAVEVTEVGGSAEAQEIASSSRRSRAAGAAAAGGAAAVLGMAGAASAAEATELIPRVPQGTGTAAQAGLAGARQHGEARSTRRPHPGVLVGAGAGVVILIVLIIVLSSSSSKSANAASTGSVTTAGASSSSPGGAGTSPGGSAAASSSSSLSASAGASPTGGGETSGASPAASGSAVSATGTAGSGASASSPAGLETFPTILATVPGSAGQAVQEIQAAVSQAKGELTGTQQNQLSQVIGTLRHEISSGQTLSTGIAQLWALLHSGELPSSLDTYLIQLATYLSASQGS